MPFAMTSQEKPRAKRKREGRDEKSDAEGRHAGDLVEDAQHDNLVGRVVQPVEGDGRTNAGSGKQVKKLKKKPIVRVVTRGPLSPKPPRPTLSLRPSNITSSGHEREPVSTSMEL